MDTKRELWAAAYRFYQEQCKVIDAGVADFSEYFIGLAMEIAERSKGGGRRGRGTVEGRVRDVREKGESGRINPIAF